MTGDAPVTLDLDRIGAVIFDMDGVVTDTARVHSAAWKRTFDEYLEDRAGSSGEAGRPFRDQDYRLHMDGKPRYDGVRDFLASRGISLPEGNPSDPPDAETICGLGNRKDLAFLARLREGGADLFPDTVALIRELRERGVPVAVISASRNMREVLAAAGTDDLFDVRVDGRDAVELGLDGKPAPDVFLEAARRLGVEPGRAAVVEDALAGVEAGRRGGFALVIGVDRTGHADALRKAGADVVVSEVGQVRLTGRSGERSDLPSVADLPSALDRREEIGDRLRDRRSAVFLDYDGTLTPIVNDPAAATLPEPTREVLERLAAVRPVGVISGRDLADVRALVGIEGIAYAGSHGFDILAPDGSRHERGGDFAEALDAAEARLRPAVEEVPGARLERKRFALTVHFRQADEARVPELERVVDAVVEDGPKLRKTGGKKIFELRPNLDWDKGEALLLLLQVLGLDASDVVPTYVGDDETDEDAFRAIRDRGLGFIVRGEGDDRPTAASYSLADTDEVRELLALLAPPVEGAPR